MAVNFWTRASLEHVCCPAQRLSAHVAGAGAPIPIATAIAGAIERSPHFILEVKFGRQHKQGQEKHVPRFLAQDDIGGRAAASQSHRNRAVPSLQSQPATSIAEKRITSPGKDLPATPLQNDQNKATFMQVRHTHGGLCYSMRQRL